MLHLLAIASWTPIGITETLSTSLIAFLSAQKFIKTRRHRQYRRTETSSSSNLATTLVKTDSTSAITYRSYSQIESGLNNGGNKQDFSSLIKELQKHLSTLIAALKVYSIAREQLDYHAYVAQMDLIASISDTLEKNIFFCEDYEYHWQNFYEEKRRALELFEKANLVKSLLPESWANNIRVYIQAIGEPYDDYLKKRELLLTKKHLHHFEDNYSVDTMRAIDKITSINVFH